MMNYSTFDEAVRALKRGEVIIFPTETIYGLGCLASDETALLRLFEIKGRAPDKPPPVLVANETQLNSLVAEIPPVAARLMREHWPGALTLILPAREGLSAALTGLAGDGSTPTIGVRQTPHPLARALCEAAAAPLVATSANFSGAIGSAATPRSLDDIPLELQTQADAVLDGGVLGGAPSTVIDCLSTPPQVLRVGAVEVLSEEA